MQASELASHILCDCEALATLRYKCLGHHFVKPGDFEDISVCKILHFAQDAGLLNESGKGLQKRLVMVQVHRSWHCLPFCILF